MPDFSIAKTQPVLQLDCSLQTEGEVDTIGVSFSAVVFSGTHLWLGGDEGTYIDRLTVNAKSNFNGHVRFDLRELVNLPFTGRKSEIDIEGLDVDGGCLWLMGSHSLKRGKPRTGKTVAENFERLAAVKADGNRFTLARVPLDAGSEPVKRSDSIRAARLKGDETGNLLTRVLAADPHIGPFCGIPGKDNGLDAEGLAVRGCRAFIGLRGPVLRGWAIVLETELKDSGVGEMAFAKPLRKHFLQLDGLGVRDLAIRGDDVYILAGPTMNLDGPVFVYRWSKALASETEAVISRDQLQKVLAVPFGRGMQAGKDHAEGLTFTDAGGGTPEVLICYDSPADKRVRGQGRVCVDVFRLS